MKLADNYPQQSAIATQIPPTQQGLSPLPNPPIPNQSQPVASPATVYPSTGQGTVRASAGGNIPPHTQAIGSAGTVSYSGYPREDYLDKMMGYQKALIYDQMRRSDSAVKMCLAAVMNPIKDSTIDIEPADPENPEYVKHADFIRFLLLEDMDKPFEDFLAEALTALIHGHACFEQIDKICMGHPDWGNYIGIKAFSFISQKTILRWYLDGQTGELTGIMQLAYGDLARNVTIPAEFLIVFSMDKEGSNYEGISLLRPAYGAWWRKDNYLKINAIGIEKFAIPTPFVEVPEGKENSTQYDSLVEALEIYTTHQSNWLTYPQGWKLDLKPTVYDPQKVEISIDNEDKRIAKAFLGNFLELGMGGAGTGNRAMSEDLSSFFLGSVKFIAKELAAVIRKTAIKRAIDLKFGPQAKYPDMKFNGIDDKAGVEFAQMMKFFADSQIITPDDILEEHIRKRVGLPKMSLKGQRAVKAVGAAGVEGPANPAYKQMSETTRNLVERMRLAEIRKNYQK